MNKMTKRFASIALAALWTTILPGCGPGDSDPMTAPPMPVFDGDRMATGRSVWMGTCRNCHLLGIAGAPAVTNFAEWDKRLPKGKDALYQSALNGIKGPDGNYRMPPHGGNDRLSDEQVRLAVDYKIEAIKQLSANSR